MAKAPRIVVAPDGTVRTCIHSFRWIAYLGEPTAQLLLAVFESSASTPAAHALANE
jgi:hypothetical protein